MKQVIDVPEYDPVVGLRVEWEFDFHIATRVDDQGVIVITANSPGLISLARHLLLLAQPSVPKGHHLHLDVFNSLEEGSRDIIVERG